MLLGVDKLDHRGDSPMQESITNGTFFSNRQGANSHGPVRTPTPDQSLPGFTAVNGMKSHSAPFWSDSTAHPRSHSSGVGAVRKTVSSESEYDLNHWRRDGMVHRERASESPGAIGKRKRVDEVNIESTGGVLATTESGEDKEPLDNRISTLDSAIDLTSPNTHGQSQAFSTTESDSSEHGQFGPYQREPSPTERWDKREPLPKPRPETEATLAASLQQFQQQQTQLVREVQHHSMSSAQRPTPPNDRDDGTESYPLSDDAYNGDTTDAKRRKRNFSNRTKTGCHTCRRRKKKCDETKPICMNCDRGKFTCEGYGPKPPGFKHSNHNRAAIPLQSKTPMAPYNGRQSDAASTHAEAGRSYSHWGRVDSQATHSDSEPSRHLSNVAPAVVSRGSSGDNWTNPSYTSHEAPPPSLPRQAPPRPYHPPMVLEPVAQQPNVPPYPSHYPSTAPPPSRQKQHSSHHQHTPLPQPRQDYTTLHPPMVIEPWAQLPSLPPHQLQSGPLPSSRESMGSGSNRSSVFHMGYSASNPYAEKDKMLRGQPFLHYLDPVLRQDRQACKAVLEAYNDTAITTSRLGERAKLFTQILKPNKRKDAELREHPHNAPTGSIEDHSIVESPFTCEYGYNIHIGKDCVVESGCFFQDAADICLGNRVIIGHNVKLYCITVSLDSNVRKGSQGTVVAGCIKIEDDCFIGADVTIMPYVTIGKGAVIGAGSVVTKDIEEYTVVAGNPARFVRRIEGPNMNRHHNQQIQRQQDKAIDWMVRYANSGFAWYTSPRL